MLGGHHRQLDIDLEHDRIQRALSDLQRVRAESGDRLVGVLNVVIEQTNPVQLYVGNVVDRDAAAHTVERERIGKIKLSDAAARDRRAENRGVQHSRSLNVGGELRASGDL